MKNDTIYYKFFIMLNQDIKKQVRLTKMNSVNLWLSAAQDFI